MIRFFSPLLEVVTSLFASDGAIFKIKCKNLTYENNFLKLIKWQSWVVSGTLITYRQSKQSVCCFHNKTHKVEKATNNKW